MLAKWRDGLLVFNSSSYVSYNTSTKEISMKKELVLKWYDPFAVNDKLQVHCLLVLSGAVFSCYNKSYTLYKDKQVLSISQTTTDTPKTMNMTVIASLSNSAISQASVCSKFANELTKWVEHSYPRVKRTNVITTAKE
jgi:hypothetical protein